MFLLTRLFLQLNHKSKKKLILRKREGYIEHNIKMNTDSVVERIDPSNKSIYLKNRKDPISYGKLIIATGSNARFLPFGNPNLDGMFTLRNIEDADKIKNYIEQESVKDVLVIGGGLLGIELGYHLRELDLNVSICELAPYLLPRQMDRGTSNLLKK